MKNFKSHFWYTKSQRNGIFILLLLIILLQFAYFFIDVTPDDTIVVDSEDVTALQSEIDSLKEEKLKKQNKIFPFNPNFISDYKGERLGMSLEEIDRLHKFRAGNKYVNSIQEFQRVTKVSDSLLDSISPYFKFPDWVKSKKPKKRNNQKEKNSEKKLKIVVTTNDLNRVTFKDLLSVTGIKETIAKRIIKYRSKLKGFTFEDQLYEVWDLDKESADEILKSFKITEVPKIQKINVNTASFKEILKLPYIDYELCQKIFDYKDEVAELQNIEELRNIKDFPQKKYDRIVLYLMAK